MKNYIPTIGLEIHAELKTKSKMFCGCKNDPFCKEPNIHTCPVCLGLPGALPVINKQAVIDTIKIGKALNGTIAPITKWDRKHYFYPDLPKGYQISQYDLPLVTGGSLEMKNQKSKIKNINQNLKISDEGTKTIRITRIHLEEDTGKLMHEPGSGNSLVDLNRAGVPLVELVTEPDIHDGKTAAEFAREYQLILRALGVSDASMEKGMMRVEVNISVTNSEKLITNSHNAKLKAKNNTSEVAEGLLRGGELGTKVEIKNLNSFKSVERAIEYEIKRQTELLEKGEKIVQETRGWSDERGTTISQRVKETSADYRYFPEPDLPPINTTKLEIGETTPLPNEIRNDLMEAGINQKEVEIILNNSTLLSQIANFRLKIKDLRLKNNLNYEAEAAKILIHYPQAREKSTEELIKLTQMTPHDRKMILEGKEIGEKLSEDEIRSVVREVINNEQDALARYRAGKTGLSGFFVGEVMRKVKNQADPASVGRIVQEMLK